MSGFFTEHITKESTIAADEKKIESISIAKIQADPNQVRKTFDEENLEELANSIKEEGILNPLHVYVEGNKYTILTGERRFRASKLAGLSIVPCIVYEEKPDEKKIIAIQLIENLQRSDLSALEESRGYRALREQGLSQAAIARQLGKSEGTVSKGLTILKKFPEEWIREIEDSQIKFSIPELYGVVKERHKNKRNAAYQKLMASKNKEVELELEEEKPKERAVPAHKEFSEEEYKTIWKVLVNKTRRDKSKLSDYISSKKLLELLEENEEE